MGSLTVVVLTGMFTGAVLALQSGMTLDQFGARPFVGRLVSASMIKELGPVLTGLMLTTRAGPALRRNWDRWSSPTRSTRCVRFGTDPIRKLVVPRVLAGTLMSPVLTIVSDFVGILGGWLIAVLQLRVASSLYWSSVLESLYPQDPWMGLLEAVLPWIRHRQYQLPCRAADQREGAPGV